jgi:hypothetical protein
MDTKHNAKRITYRIPYTLKNQDSNRHCFGVNRLIRNSSDLLFSAGRDSTIRQWRLEKERDIMVIHQQILSDHTEFNKARTMFLTTYRLGKRYYSHRS